MEQNSMDTALSPPPWIDMARQLEINDTLVYCDIIDDVISLIQCYAKQKKLMILPYHDGNELLIHTALVYDPSCDGWDSGMLEESLYNYDTDIFVQDKKIITIDGDSTSVNKYVTKIFDFSSGKKTKETLHDNICDEIKLTSQIFKNAFLDNFVGLIDITSSNGNIDGEIFYDCHSCKFYEMPMWKGTDGIFRIIYSPLQEHSYGRLFATFFDTFSFCEYNILQQLWMLRHKPTFEIEWNSIHLVYYGYIYIIDLTTGQCQSYNINKDEWNVLCRLPHTEQVFHWSTRIAGIMDNTLLVERTQEDDESKRILISLDVMNSHSTWQIRKPITIPQLTRFISLVI